MQSLALECIVGEEIDRKSFMKRGEGIRDNSEPYLFPILIVLKDEL